MPVNKGQGLFDSLARAVSGLGRPPAGAQAHNVTWVFPLKRRIMIGIYAIFGTLLAMAMVFVVLALRQSLLRDAEHKTRELGSALHSSLSALMLKRNPGLIQGTLADVAGGSEGSIVKAFILDRSGKVAYSSSPGDIGLVIDRFADPSCRGCHSGAGIMPAQHTTKALSMGVAVQRNVRVIYNEERCFGCHQAADRVNGKIIVDRSLAGTSSMVLFVEIIIFGSGFLCLVISYPFLSRSVDRYIEEIVRQNSELMLLYVMVERLSKTIDPVELREIIATIIRDTFEAERVDFVVMSHGLTYHRYSLDRDAALLRRMRVEDDDDLHRAVREWLRFGLTTERVSADGRAIYLPISKGDEQIALIAARKGESRFESVSVEVLRVISGHIAMALENARLYVLAITDELTGLYSYRHFMHSLTKHLGRHEGHGERLSLLMLDIDDFKRVNDVHGHEAGNFVLHELAERIRYSTRDNDIAFRYGGEEFAVILPTTDSEGAVFVAERMRRNIEAAPFLKGSLDLSLTVSIGVSSYPRNASSVRQLVALADDALYQAKAMGKNRVTHSTAAPTE